tara:strand:+ start:4169 stop:4270 length:102 start_codon:yes stop_codon:yes gene_type:complete
MEKRGVLSYKAGRRDSGPETLVSPPLMKRIRIA